MSPAKWRPFCLGHNDLIHINCAKAFAMYCFERLNNGLLVDACCLFNNISEDVSTHWSRVTHICVRKLGGRLNIKMSSYQYKDSHVKDYKNPLHLDVVDRCLRRMGDKTIPDEAPPSLESFYPPWVAGIDLPQSRCFGFFVSFTNKHK